MVRSLDGGARYNVWVVGIKSLTLYEETKSCDGGGVKRQDRVRVVV